ncbi:L,D-transpeptidase family protein [Ancylobacter pratisalsi]|nr:murein L,D-transpeptidase family protein [Ancylobacter pratisalsi]
MALLGGCAALALAGCTGDDSPSINAKAMKSLSPQTLALLNQKGMSKTSPLVVRIYKEESELEVWKQNSDGDYALLKTYPICRWSGELGPKVREGDRQAPEGFYTITPGQMNPNSSYYLSFDLGFPNAYDRAWGRSGSNLMVHGDCSSRGCYAMTDEQVQEIFALGRESFRGGQRAFQVQAYPFRMTAENLVRHRNNPNLAFWKMLKEGSDTFEITKAQPKVDYCGKRYVFDATPVDPSQKFQASQPCPEYTQPEGLQQALASRQQDVNTRIASAGSLAPLAPVKTGKDGGMHKVFLAKLENPELSAPGSLPPVVKPPGSEYGVATNEPAPAESIALATADMVPTSANVPLPLPRPTDAPGGGSQVAAQSAPSFLGRLIPSLTPAETPDAPAANGTPAAPPSEPTQVAALESGGGFFDGVRSLFSRSSEPAPSEPAAAETSSGFSFGRLFGGGASEPSPDAEPNAAALPVQAPVPPEKPAAPAQSAAREAAIRDVASRQSAPHQNAARPAATSTTAVAPATTASATASATSAASQPRPAATPSMQRVPSPGQAAAAAYYQSLPAQPGAQGAPAAAVATSVSASTTPALRPSVAANGQEPLYGSSSGSGLPGAAILTPGTFSSAVQ